MQSSFYNVKRVLFQSSNRFYRTSRANSQRHNRSSHYEPTEYFKLAARNSVYNGVKHSDEGFITGRDLNKLRAYDNKPEDLSFVDSSQALKQIRKKYDDTKKQNVEKEKLLTRLKEEAQYRKNEENQYIRMKTDANNATKDLEVRLEKRKNDYEQMLMEKKCMMSIVHRMKEDKVIYDQRKFQAEQQLKHLKKQSSFNEIDETSIVEGKDRARLVNLQLIAKLEAEKRSRQDHLQSLRNQLESMEEVKVVSQTRNNEIRQIAERAMQDKDDNEKNWRNLLVVHKFLSRLLKNKMDREMSKFSVVETAFKNIKIATGTSDTQTLVNKFLNKQSVYGELLSTIAENEKKIERLKQEKDELFRDKKRLDDQNNLFEATKKANNDLTKEFKNLETANEKNRRSYTSQRNLNQWLTKQLKRIDKFQKKQPRSPISNTLAAMEQYVSWVEKHVDWLTTEHSTADHSEIDPSDIGRKNQQKLLRVKPRKYRKNSSGQDELEEDDDQTDIIHPSGIAEQQDYLSLQNTELLRGNDKFMKELKKKREMQAKLRMDLSPKKPEKPQKAPEVKKEVQEE